jgi:hypothetical protein
MRDGVGCGGPADNKVATAFLKENPTVTVTAIRSGEGDRSTVYKHIRYRTTGSMTECEVVWANKRDMSGRFFTRASQPWRAQLVRTASGSRAHDYQMQFQRRPSWPFHRVDKNPQAGVIRQKLIQVAGEAWSEGHPRPIRLGWAGQRQAIRRPTCR